MATKEWNDSVIEEFRANGGRVGGPFEGATLLLLHSIGARTGEERVTPVVYRPVDGGYAVFGSYAGRDVNPAWFHNLVAHPDVEIEVGDRRIPVRARVTSGDERERIWSAQKAAVPTFAEYETKTTREIPVVVLEPL